MHRLPIPGRFTHFEMPKELTVEEIKEFVDWQAEAAVIAKKAGFDGIEIETNSGYLYGQFFSADQPPYRRVRRLSRKPLQFHG